VKTIGRSAFCNCPYLESVFLPLTLEDIGGYAFANCVHLSQIAPRPQVKLGEDVFFNCPTLGFVSSYTPEAFEWKPRTLKALANPENSKERVEILTMPKASAVSKGSVECGWYLDVMEQAGAFYKVSLHFPGMDGGEEGYVPVAQVQMVDYLQGLFEPVRVMALPGRDSVPGFGYESVPAGEKGKPIPLPQGHSLAVTKQSGQTFWAEMDSGGYLLVKVSDVTLFAREIPQGKRYGVVISGDTRDRLHLRNRPSKAGESLGKFFSGTQVDILGEEGNWYKVRVGFDEGYMMKEFVREVKEWKEP
jgi:hypothetical protein